MTGEKKTEKLIDSLELFDKIQDEHKDFDVNMHLAVNELPDLGEIEVYDYDKDIKDAVKLGKSVVNNIVNLFLGDLPDIISHPYINIKAHEDAAIYAETILLIKERRRAYINQMRLIDNGENGHRNNEVLNQTMKEMREDIKFNLDIKTKIEGFYKDMGKEFTEKIMAKEKELKEIKEIKDETKESNDGVKIIDTNDLNEKIRLATSNKK